MVDLIRQLLVSRWSLLLPFTLLTLLSSAGLGLKGIPVVLSFALHGLGLAPLGRMVAVLVHALARRLGNRLGGLVSVTLGNLVDLVVLFTALNSGLYPLVVTSLAGAVITNCLLVLGLSTLVASRRVIAVPIHPHSTQLQTQQLLISSILLSVPTIFLLHQGRESRPAPTASRALPSTQFWCRPWCWATTCSRSSISSAPIVGCSPSRSPR